MPSSALPEAEGLLSPGPDRCRFESPEGRQQLVDHVELVDELHAAALGHLEPLIEVGRRR